MTFLETLTPVHTPHPHTLAHVPAHVHRCTLQRTLWAQQGRTLHLLSLRPQPELLEPGLPCVLLFSGWRDLPSPSFCVVRGWSATSTAPCAMALLSQDHCSAVAWPTPALALPVLPLCQILAVLQLALCSAQDLSCGWFSLSMILLSEPFHPCQLLKSTRDSQIACVQKGR